MSDESKVVDIFRSVDKVFCTTCEKVIHLKTGKECGLVPDDEIDEFVGAAFPCSDEVHRKAARAILRNDRKGGKDE